MEQAEEKINYYVSTTTGLTLKATELRLGLPGSESAERDIGNCIHNNKKNDGGNEKTEYSVSVNGGGSLNWGLSGTREFDPDFSSKVANELVSGSDSDHPVMNGGSKTVVQVQKSWSSGSKGHACTSAAKAEVIGWPPIRSFQKTTMASHTPKNTDNAEGKLGSECLYVKVSMDGAPYLRKVDLKNYGSYAEFYLALGRMFSCFTIGQHGSRGLCESRLTDLLRSSEYVLTYEDRDGDWMLVGDVPWKMFTDSCRRLRIMKNSEAVGLAPSTQQKCKNQC